MCKRTRETEKKESKRCSLQYNNNIILMSLNSRTLRRCKDGHLWTVVNSFSTSENTDDGSCKLFPEGKTGATGAEILERGVQFLYIYINLMCFMYVFYCHQPSFIFSSGKEEMEKDGRRW